MLDHNIQMKVITDCFSVVIYLLIILLPINLSVFPSNLQTYPSVNTHYIKKILSNKHFGKSQFLL